MHFSFKRLLLGAKRDILSVKPMCFALLFLSLTTSLKTAYGQANFGVSANYVFAFGERIIPIQNTTYYLNTTNGYELSANGYYRFGNSRIEAVYELGFRLLNFSGRTDNTHYQGQLMKLTSGIGCRYELANRWNATAFIEAENNLDFDEFYLGMGDLFRISLSVEGMYEITPRIGLTCLLNRAMTPITEAYIIPNPQYQIRFGFTYKFLK